MQKFRAGDLTVGTARIGAKVRCVGVPDISLWQDRHKVQFFQVPQLSKIYTIRSNIIAYLYRGVLLEEVKNPEVSIVLPSGVQISGEPFFVHSSFFFVSS